MISFKLLLQAGFNVFNEFVLPEVNFVLGLIEVHAKGVALFFKLLDSKDCIPPYQVRGRLIKPGITGSDSSSDVYRLGWMI